MPQKLQITNSNIIALWQLMFIAKTYENIEVQTAIQIAINSNLIGGSSPAQEGLQLGLKCKILLIYNNKLTNSDYCKNEILPLCDEDLPNINIVRTIILCYLSQKPLEWLLFYDNDPIIFRNMIPKEWVDILDYANLFEFENTLVLDWWTTIFSKYETYKEGKKLEQGKLTEKFTFDSEIKRLKSDGFDSDSKHVKWASQISDKYGYDILSKRGILLQDTFSKFDKVQIEVKCTVSSSKEEFRFFITKNEWKSALQNINSYYFYCWINTNIHSQTADGPFIIAAKNLIPYIPKDEYAEICEWSECRFILDLNKYCI